MQTSHVLLPPGADSLARVREHPSGSELSPTTETNIRMHSHQRAHPTTEFLSSNVTSRVCHRVCSAHVSSSVQRTCVTGVQRTRFARGDRNGSQQHTVGFGRPRQNARLTCPAALGFDKARPEAYSEARDVRIASA